MSMSLHSLLVFIVVLFGGQCLQAQIAPDTRLRTLDINTEIRLLKDFSLPAGSKSILLESGKGKICSCQFFAKESEETRLFAKDQIFSLKSVTIKGIFDGSQMHVARIFLNETAGYFKFKCYARDILVEHVSDFLEFDTTGLVEKSE